MPHARLLSNGSYTALVTGAGTGFSARNGTALTAWSADRVADGEGFFFYLRDADRGMVWSLGYQPVRAEAESYEAFATDGVVRIARLAHGIESSLEI
ncbi:MAG: hypothetical protein ACREQ9_20340, partial [Candidatus Binatia bacterium]